MRIRTSPEENPSPKRARVEVLADQAHNLMQLFESRGYGTDFAYALTELTLERLDDTRNEI